MILTATAIGGVLATRMGKGPFVLAASAAALAYLNQKKPAPTSVPSGLPLSQPVVEPPPDIPVQSQIEQWLSRQFTREEQTPLIALSDTSDELKIAEDNYLPPSFLLDEAEEAAAVAPTNDTFADLTEPVQRYITVPTPPIEIEPEPVVISAPVLELPPPTPAAEDATWTLGVEPLPSLNESAPFAPFASSMFFTAPVQQQEPEPLPTFSAPLFEGAAFPDEIDVVPATEPEQEAEPVAHLTPTPPPQVFPPLEPEPLLEPPPPETKAAPEISVQLAAPGEASFDPPLADVPYNPWQPVADIPVTPHASPVQSHTTSPIVEAEIILRPRAPMQNTVTPKSKFIPPAFGKHFPAENNDAPSADDAGDSQFSGPLQSPREPRARPTWRSWWRGD